MCIIILTTYVVIIIHILLVFVMLLVLLVCSCVGVQFCFSSCCCLMFLFGFPLFLFLLASLFLSFVLYFSIPLFSSVSVPASVSVCVSVFFLFVCYCLLVLHLVCFPSRGSPVFVFCFSVYFLIVYDSFVCLLCLSISPFVVVLVFGMFTVIRSFLFICFPLIYVVLFWWLIHSLTMCFVFRIVVSLACF